MVAITQILPGRSARPGTCVSGATRPVRRRAKNDTERFMRIDVIGASGNVPPRAFDGGFIGRPAFGATVRGETPKYDRNGCPTAQIACVAIDQLHSCAVLVDDFLHDRQTEPGSARFGRHIRFKCAPKYIRRKTRTIVFDRQAHGARFGR
jgi:hypothetical protein